jgi:crotonobetainyl-CoA:carnitine CoA-transferase CaiB-like acyl-CoA transferase
MPESLLKDLLRAAGCRDAGRDEISFSGSDPVFPIPFRVGEMGAAAIGASALQAARLWELRTSRRQQVSVDVDAATAAMRSSRYLRIEPIPGQPEPAVNWNSRGGGGRRMYEARDGRWVYFQREFEYHRDRITGVLKCEDSEEGLDKAVAGWDAFELEEAVVTAGACAGVVRTAAEWSAHDQGKAVAGLPLLEVMRIGDSPPEALPAGDRPLSGLRVLDLTRVLAGPTCARTLAEHGADVLRVSSSRLPDDPSQAIDTGHGKRGADIDLLTATGVDQLRGLIGGADVFSQAFRPGSLAARGFGPEAVAKLRPGIVYMSLSAFGHEGPWRDRRGFDSLVQAVSGIGDEFSVTRPPRSLPMNPLDYATGYMAAFGIMAALERRAREGGSYHVRVSLAQTGRWLTSQPRVDAERLAAAQNELPPERLASLMTETATPYGLLRHLKPIAWMSETPPRWDLPSVPLGHHKPEWLPR